MRKLEQFFKNHKNPKILDVGTGRGNFIALIDYLYKDYDKIVGIDISKRAIEMAKESFKTNEKIVFVERDILKTGFPEKHFDIICLANSLHHLDKIPETFQAMRELLKPDGDILVFEMQSDQLNKAQISHRLIHHFAAKVDRMLGRIHNDTYTKQEMLELLGKLEDLKIVDNFEFVTEQEEVSEDDVNGLIDQVDLLRNQLKDKGKELKDEAEAIKQYIRENGFASCTSEVVILKKASDGS